MSVFLAHAVFCGTRTGAHPMGRTLTQWVVLRSAPATQNRETLYMGYCTGRRLRESSTSSSDTGLCRRHSLGAPYSNTQSFSRNSQSFAKNARSFLDLPHAFVFCHMLF